jgi:hypothetical protein
VAIDTLTNTCSVRGGATKQPKAKCSQQQAHVSSICPPAFAMNFGLPQNAFRGRLRHKRLPHAQVIQSPAPISVNNVGQSFQLT